MSQVAESLTEKLQTLSPQQLTEVETFVSELLDPQTTNLVRSTAQLSEPSLWRVWNNPEDDVYNDL
jgi:hypothetical protein